MFPLGRITGQVNVPEVFQDPFNPEAWAPPRPPQHLFSLLYRLGERCEFLRVVHPLIPIAQSAAYYGLDAPAIIPPKKFSAMTDRGPYPGRPRHRPPPGALHAARVENFSTAASGGAQSNCPAV